MIRYLFITLQFIGTAVFSQRPNFVYIQSEPAQSFTVKLGEQNFQSSPSGYLILSQLTDTAYPIAVHFPSTLWPVQHFTLEVNHTDKGYLLKDFGDKGWGLMDWRKLTVQYSLTKNHSMELAMKDSSQTKVDDFASLLAKASGDPSLQARTEKKADSLLSKQAGLSVKDSVIEATTFITKEADTTTKEGVSLVYIDKKTKGQEDTIQLLIPNKVARVVEELPKHCKVITTEVQLSVLQQQWQALLTDEKKMESLKRHGENHCFTVSQIRELANYFSTDEKKYNFLLEAWSFTSDRNIYGTLAALFQRKEIADRFKELVQ